jgi:hypothetical protein
LPIAVDDASMSLSERARDRAREHPFVLAGLRSGILNYRATAEFLDLDGDPDAVATALRRFAETLPEYTTESRDAHVTIHGGVGVVSADDVADATPHLRIGNRAVCPDAGDRTAVVATGDVDAAALWAVLGRLRTAEVDVVAAGVDEQTLVVVVERRAGATAVRLVEAALSAVPA